LCVASLILFILLCGIELYDESPHYCVRHQAPVVITRGLTKLVFIILRCHVSVASLGMRRIMFVGLVDIVSKPSAAQRGCNNAVPDIHGRILRFTVSARGNLLSFITTLKLCYEL